MLDSDPIPKPEHRCTSRVTSCEGQCGLRRTANTTRCYYHEKVALGLITPKR